MLLWAMTVMPSLLRLGLRLGLKLGRLRFNLEGVLLLVGGWLPLPKEEARETGKIEGRCHLELQERAMTANPVTCRL